MSLDRKREYEAKDKIRVRVETPRERIDGLIHVLFRHRASDLLNDETRFIPVTEATVTPHGLGAEPWQAEFVAVNKDYIVLLREEGGQTQKSGGSSSAK